MHIECVLHRDGGSKIDLGGILYHFAPQPDGAHVSLVENPDHQDRFLSISEGYRLYRGEFKPADASTAIATAAAPVAPRADDGDEQQVILLGSDQHDAHYTVHGVDYALGYLVARAQAASCLNPADWNSLSDDGRADLIDEELNKLADAGAPPTDPEALRAELVEQFKAKFGKAPHHKATVETIRAKLAESAE